MGRQDRKQNIIARYGKNASGDIVIDVAAQKVDDLYNTFDRFSPDNRKDLNGDLVTYILDCAREINELPFALRINLPALPEAGERATIRNSFRSFFVYLVDIEKRNMARRVRTSLILLCAGLVLLVLALAVSQRADSNPSILLSVFAEGLTVAAWVALWQALATYLIHWAPYHRTIALYRRLAAADLEFAATSTRADTVLPQ